MKKSIFIFLVCTFYPLFSMEVSSTENTIEWTVFNTLSGQEKLYVQLSSEKDLYSLKGKITEFQHPFNKFPAEEYDMNDDIAELKKGYYVSYKLTPLDFPLCCHLYDQKAKQVFIIATMEKLKAAKIGKYPCWSIHTFPALNPVE